MSSTTPSRSVIWASRGRSWGSLFLLDGGLPDPLPRYDEMFANLDGVREGYDRIGSSVALRFRDPEERRDVAGRVIVHEMVVDEAWSQSIESLEDGRSRVWPVVAQIYALIWDSEGPPSTAAVRDAVDRQGTGALRPPER